jgi:nucleoside-diphosphate-sugar epimerase
LYGTGATGYIGGSVFATLLQKHPEYDITVLLRKLPANFSSQFPNVKLVLGGFDSFEIISEAAAEADVAIRKIEPNSDHYDERLTKFRL